MPLQHEKPFIPTRLEEDRAKDKSKVITVRLNLEELEMLESDARLLRQEKIGTAIKQGWLIGRNVLHRPEMEAIIDTVFNNERRNERLGIGIANPKFTQM